LNIKLLLLLYFSILCTGFAQEMDIDTTYTEYEEGTEPAPDGIVFKPLEAAPPVEKPVYVNRSFKKGFKEAYTGSDFKYTEDIAREASLWDRFWAWLDRMLNGTYTKNKDGSVSGYGILLYTGAVLVILLVSYFIARAVMNKESMWIFGRARGRISVKDVADENIHEMEFSTLIEQTKASGDYRLAVRYYYLWLLKKLSFNEIIQWHTDKTNADYYYEIKDSALKREFEYLSYVYDYSWYGEFPLDRGAFDKAEKAFRKTLNTL
jgi:hypothetical protein